MQATDASMAISSSTSVPYSSGTHSVRQRKLDEDIEMSSSPLTEMDTSQENKTLSPIPDADLLFHLPSILIHPPNHPLHAQSLCLSLLALRKCLQTPNLNQDIECQALTALAEIGMIIIDSGYSHQEEHIWAHGVETEVEKATSKGLMIAQKHPSLRVYRSQLTFLAAQLAAWQHNVKFARNLLKRYLGTYLPSTDPPHIIYSCHLKYISLLVAPAETSASAITSDYNSSPTKLPSDVRQTLSAIQAMQTYASKHGHTGVVLLARILRLRLLVSSGLWEQINEALAEAEEALGIEISNQNDCIAPTSHSPRKALRVTDLNTVHLNPPSPTKISDTKLSNTTDVQSSPAPMSTAPSRPSVKTFESHFESNMALHTLIIGVVFFTYVGRISDATQRLSHLHALLDTGVLRFDKRPSSPDATEASSDPDGQFTNAEQSESSPEEILEREEAACGIVRVSLSDSSPPLYVQTTHPRILYILAYLVSCVAKKDPVGRRPKRKIFAIEGLATWEMELQRELRLSTWATIGDLEEIDLKLAKIKADLMCELIGVTIMRSEFDACEQAISLLIAHLRNTGLFASFSGRVTLHHAHLAHAKGQTDRAMECYEVAEAFAEERGDEFIRISARAGRACLRIGLSRDREILKKAKKEEETRRRDTRWRTRSKSREREAPAEKNAMEEDGNQTHLPGVDDWEDVQKMAEAVAEACRGMGGTMWSVGRVIEACFSDEILKSKQHLKSALSFASGAGDTHLRALILALIASHYFHTATEDALGMLGMCENLAAGLGAAVKSKGKEKAGDAIGNAPLRAWVGERSLEIYKRTGNAPAAKKQETANRELQAAIRKAKERTAKAMDL